jgi:hypothetical protein
MARILQIVIVSKLCKALLSSSLWPFDKARIIGVIGVALSAFHGNTVVAAEQTLTGSTEVIQTVDAWQNGSALPSTTGQATTYRTCQEIIQHNLSIAAEYGYSVDNQAGTFTDPKTNITIRQGCTPAAPFYIPFPVDPPGGSLPSLVTVPCPSQGVGTDVWYIIGQSNASNWGDGRYTSGQGTYMYGGDGQCYQASDPIAGTDGTGAGPWARLADLMVGQKTSNGDTITAVVIIDRAVGASSIKDWLPGRGLNSRMISSLKDAKLHGFVPTRIVWVQGEADALATTSTSEYVEDFISMLGSIRALGTKAPVWVAQATMCNLRTASNPNDPDVLWRTPDYYVDREVGRQNVRAAQQIIGGWNENLHKGANLDSIDIALRRDGCHMGSYALDQEAQLWMQAFIHPN